MGVSELPVLRLGLAGFSAEQESAIRAAAASSRLTHWEFGAMPGADAWFVNGQCSQHLGAGRLRVAPRRAGERSIQLELVGPHRPVAFAVPLPPTLDAACSFDAGRPASILDAISVFEFALAPQAARFLLAAQVVDQQEMLGTGAFELRAKGQLIAAVDMRGDAAVLPSARPGNFEIAVWKRVDRAALVMPDSFCRVSLSELMWGYVSRSTRDLLPARYRTGRIFFRRPPRVDPLLVDESHLLLMRELAIRPCGYDELLQVAAMEEGQFAQALAALYYAGSITTTLARAAPSTIAGSLSRQARAHSHYGELRTREVELTDLRQLTAPAPLVLA